MAKKLITLKIEQEMLDKLDRMAAEEFMSRSDFIRVAVTDRMRELDAQRINLAEEAGVPAKVAGEAPSEEDIFEYLRWRHQRRSMRQYMHDVDKMQRHGRPSAKDK